MNIQQAFEIQKKFSEKIIRANGYSQLQDESSDEMELSIALLASLVGWDHEIIQDESSDEHEALIESIEENPLVKDHAFLPERAKHAYETCVNICEGDEGYKRNNN